MTKQEKEVCVRDTLQEMCSYGDCASCSFFNPNDETDGQHWCFFRDKEGRIPYSSSWDMESAMEEKAR